MSHKPGIILGTALLVLGFVLFVISITVPLVSLQKPQLLLVSTSKAPLVPASGAVVNYVEYGPIANVSVPMIAPPTITTSVLFNETLVTGANGETPTVYVWVTTAPQTPIGNFTMVLTVLKVNGITLHGYRFIIKPIAGTVQTVVLPNGATATCNFQHATWLGHVACVLYMPGTEVTFIPYGLGNGELGAVYSVISYDGGSVYGFDMTAVPVSASETTVTFHYKLGLPVMGREYFWTFTVTVPVLMHYMYEVRLPLIGMFFPGWGYWPIANAVLLGVGVLLMIVGVVILLHEYHMHRRIQLFRAFGIPP
jgi:hypothetical protein